MTFNTIFISQENIYLTKTKNSDALNTGLGPLLWL